MSDGFVIEGIEDFERKLRTAPKTFPHVLESILESLGEELLNSIQDELQKSTRPHARYQMLTRTVTRGPNKGQQRNYLQYVGTTSRSSVDTGKLWNSFSRGAAGNVWLYRGSTTTFVLTVGSSVDYALYLNDGHAQKEHWVPGYADGNGIFRYSPGADTGIKVRSGYYAGTHYFQLALEDLERIAPDIIKDEVERWLREEFA